MRASDTWKTLGIIGNQSQHPKQYACNGVPADLQRLIGRGTNVPEIERFSNVIVGVSPVDSGVVSSDTNLKMVWRLATNINAENSGWIQLTAPRLVSPQEMLTW